MALKIGLLGKKIGMTQVFADDGEAVPVTVIQTGPCHVIGTRTAAKAMIASALGLSHRRPEPLSRLVSVLQKDSVGPEPIS